MMVPAHSIVFVTALFGTYERSTKEPARQVGNASFIVYSDGQQRITKSWVMVDARHYLHAEMWRKRGRNSLANNSHPFNCAKFFKMNLHRLPELRTFDIVVWLDGTIKITNKYAATLVLEMVNDGQNFILFPHTARVGLLSNEVAVSSTTKKYTAKSWLGHDQPVQDVSAQYEDYLRHGYVEQWWLTKFGDRSERPEGFGVWVTCFIVFDMRRQVSKAFLDMWWMHNVHYTTQDQVSFSYVAFKLSVAPYTLPQGSVKGDFDSNNLYRKKGHGEWYLVELFG